MEECVDRGGLWFGGVVLFAEAISLLMGTDPGLARIPVYTIIGGVYGVLVGSYVGWKSS